MHTMDSLCSLRRIHCNFISITNCLFSIMYNKLLLYSRFMLVAPSPSNMPAWYSLQLDPWSSALSTATELSNDSVAQLIRAWQAICQVVGLSPLPESLSFFPLFLSFISHLSLIMALTRFRSDCQLWSMLITEPHASCLSHHPHQTCKLGIRFGWFPGSSAFTQTRPLSCRMTQ